MPFEKIDQDIDLKFGERLAAEPTIVPAEETTSFIQSLIDNFRLNTTIGQMVAPIGGESIVDPLTGYRRDRSKANQDFDPLTLAERDNIPEEYLDNIIFTNNETEYTYERDRIKKEISAIERLGNTGFFTGLLSSASALALDPVNYVAGTGFIKAAKASSGIGQAVLRSAGIGGMSTLAVEKFLQSQQSTRSTEEVLVNSAAAALLTGVLGGASKYLSLKDKARLEKGLIDFIQNNEDISSRVEDSLSAARTVLTTKEQEGLVQKFGMKNYAKFSEGFSPIVRLMNSPFREARAMVQNLTEVSLQVAKNVPEQEGALGIASEQSVWTRSQTWNSELANSLDSAKQGYKSYRKRLKNLGLNEGRLNHSQFYEEIYRAAIRGDIHEIPEVEQAARYMRENFFNPIVKEAQELGILPDNIDLKGARSYMSRIYNKDKIRAQQPEFINRIMPSANRLYKQEIKRLENQINRFDESIKAKERLNEIEKYISKRKVKKDPVTGEVKKTPKIKKLEEEIEALNKVISKAKGITQKSRDKAFRDLGPLLEDGPQVAREIAEEITNNIINSDPLTVIPNLRPTVRGVFKERLLDIDDVKIEDFLVKDMEIILHRYKNLAVPQIETKRVFGTLNLEEALKPLRNERDRLVKEAVTDEERSKIYKSFNRSQDDLSQLWDLVNGSFNKPANYSTNLARRALSSLRTLTYLRMLGAVLTSNIPDYAGIVMSHGLRRTLGTTFKLMTNKHLRGLAKAEVRRMGTAVELTLATRVQQFYGIMDPYSNTTKIGSLSNNVTKAFTYGTLLPFWTHTSRTIASLLSEIKIGELCVEFATKGKLSKADETYLNGLGLGPGQRNMFAKLISQHGEDVDGSTIASVHRWEDSSARRTFAAAVMKDVNRQSIQKAPGDIPIFAETPIGKTLTQFMSFTLAANNKILLAGLQKQDSNTLQGAITFLGLGYLSYMLHEIRYGKEPSTDPSVWIPNTIDRSGLLALPMTIFNKSFPALRQGLGLEISKYERMKGPSPLLGPTYDTVERLWRAGNDLVATGLGDERMTQSKIRNMRLLVPGQNHNILGIGGLSTAFDALEEGMIRSFQIPKKVKNKKKGRGD